jgi:hypothetical protein
MRPVRPILLAALAALLSTAAQVGALRSPGFRAAAGSVANTGQADVVERGTLRLHYVQKPIGYERYELARAGAGLRLSSEFDFTDRGGRVQLAATLQTQPDLTPIAFKAAGKSYRFVNVDSEVTVEGGEAIVRADGGRARVPLPPPFFTVDGYAPFAVQMLLLRYWKQHGRPRTLRTVPGLPVNDVIVEARGQDRFRVGANTITLDRFAIDGVVWGRETLWLDDRGSLAAAITRAGGLGFEAVREDLEPALVAFVERATRDRIGDLERVTQQMPPLKSGTYALAGATVIDGTERPPIADAIVVVRDGPSPMSDRAAR